MPRASSSSLGLLDPTHGLRTLAQLVEDALAALCERPAFATAGPSPLLVPYGPLVANQSLEATTPHRSKSRFGGAGRARGDAPPVEPQDPELIDDEHVETWRLVTLAQAGDGEAFGQLYDRYVDSIYRFIYYRVNDRALAEDFTSETFLRALRRITTISYQGRDIGAWFVTIARNIVLDHVKSARNRLEMTTGDTIESREVTPSTESAVLDSLTSEHLLAAVKRLGDEQRECVMLRFIQGFSVAETAAVMGKNEGAIKALQHRAVKKLAELVGEDIR